MSIHAGRSHFLSLGALIFLAALLSACPAWCQEDTHVEYTSEGLKDPFKSCLVKEAQPASVAPDPQTVVVRPLPALSIQGVFWNGNFPQAIVNDHVVREGDIVEEARVVSITRKNIKFVFANREFSVSPAEVQTGMNKLPESRKEAP